MANFKSREEEIQWEQSVLEKAKQDPMLQKIDFNELYSAKDVEHYLNAPKGEHFLMNVSGDNRRLRVFPLDRFPDVKRLNTFYMKGESQQTVKIWNGYFNYVEENFLVTKGSVAKNKIGRIAALNQIEDCYLTALVNMPVGNAFMFSSKDSFMVTNDNIVTDKILFIKKDNSNFLRFENAKFRKDGGEVTKDNKAIYKGETYLYNSMLELLPKITEKLSYKDVSKELSLTKEDLQEFEKSAKKGAVYDIGSRLSLMRSVTKPLKKKVTKTKEKDASKMMGGWDKVIQQLTER